VFSINTSDQLSKYVYPFTAIVGQEEMKLGLLLNAINPKLSGVLIRGEKGTAKSTAVRALAALLPDNHVVAGCPFGCDPDDPAAMCASCRERLEQGESLPVAVRRMQVVELPVSATEDRVVGTLDLEEAIKKGEKRFEPGVLAASNRNLLYVDEVNLLDDHIVDVLLDSAAMGVSTVEREGVSFTHPASFILVGTMNPEEGELRPQLLDRFGLCVQIEGIRDPALRVEVIRRRASFEDDPAGFCDSCAAEQEQLRQRIAAAKGLLPRVQAPDRILYLIAETAVAMGVDGHRADLTMLKAAKTMAALQGRDEVLESDIRATADMALRHRMRRRPFQEIDIDRDKLDSILGRDASGAHIHTHPHTHTYSHTHSHAHTHE
jgi:magnesium chelatase subunit I